jgi:hypothetical protein
MNHGLQKDLLQRAQAAYDKKQRAAAHKALLEEQASKKRQRLDAEEEARRTERLLAAMHAPTRLDTLDPADNEDFSSSPDGESAENLREECDRLREELCEAQLACAQYKGQRNAARIEATALRTQLERAAVDIQAAAARATAAEERGFSRSLALAASRSEIQELRACEKKLKLSDAKLQDALAQCQAFAQDGPHPPTLLPSCESENATPPRLSSTLCRIRPRRERGSSTAPRSK